MFSGRDKLYSWRTPKMTFNIFRFAIVVFSFILGSVGASQVNSDKPGKVILRPPLLFKNSTLLVTKTEIFIKWQAPNVYQIHNVSVNYDWLDNNDTSDADILTNSTEATTGVPGASNGTSETYLPAEPGVDNSSNSSVDFTNGLQKPKCVPEKDFMEINVISVLSKTFDQVIKHVADKKNDSLVHVDFDKGCVERYIVSCAQNGNDVHTTEISPDITEYNITDLQPGQNYTISVSAVFTSNDTLKSNEIHVVTKTDNTAECHCSMFGAVENYTCSTKKFPWCKCKPNYAGAFCEICRPGYYRSAPYFPCHRCPCSPLATLSPTCHYREGYLVCDRCKTHYTGHLCQSCTPGYYRYHGRCIPCHCNFNNDPNVSMCDPYSGACKKCIHNTTGMNCERCVTGYVREKAQHKFCVLAHEAQKTKMEAGPSNGLIAGICIAVLLTLCAVVGFIVYRRWKTFPQRKPFWTVELKEDRDSVNFSAIPEHDYVQHGAADIADLEFYEKHRGKSNRKDVSNYSQLREEI